MPTASGEIMGMSYRQFLHQVLNFGLIVASALLIWKTMSIISITESPIVVVLSGSMEPSFYRGDLLFLWGNENRDTQTGDTVVYSIAGKGIPIVHRVLNTHTMLDDSQLLLTKGDNNPVNDRGLYNPGQLWVHPTDLLGRVVGYVPYVGYFTIVMNDFPIVKYVMIGGLFLFILVSNEK